MDGFFDKFRSVQPYLVNDTPRARTRAASRRPREHERYDDTTKCILCAACTTLVPVVLGAAVVRRAGGDRQRPSVHLRLARRRRRRAARDPGRQGRRVALPDDLQLHRRLPARDQHHPGDPRSERRHRGAQDLSEHVVPRPRSPSGRGRRPTPAAAVGRAGSSSGPTAPPAATRARRRSVRRCTTSIGPDARDHRAVPDASISDYLGIQTNNVAEYTGDRAGARAGARAGRPRGPPAARFEAHRRAARRPLAGQGRQAHPALDGVPRRPSRASSAGPRPTSRAPRTRWPTRWRTRRSTAPRRAARRP